MARHLEDPYGVDTDQAPVVEVARSMSLMCRVCGHDHHLHVHVRRYNNIPVKLMLRWVDPHLSMRAMVSGFKAMGDQPIHCTALAATWWLCSHATRIGSLVSVDGLCRTVNRLRKHRQERRELPEQMSLNQRWRAQYLTQVQRHWTATVESGGLRILVGGGGHADGGVHLLGNGPPIFASDSSLIDLRDMRRMVILGLCASPEWILKGLRIYGNVTYANVWRWIPRRRQFTEQAALVDWYKGTLVFSDQANGEQCPRCVSQEAHLQKYNAGKLVEYWRARCPVCLETFSAMR